MIDTSQEYNAVQCSTDIPVIQKYSSTLLPLRGLLRALGREEDDEWEEATEVKDSQLSTQPFPTNCRPPNHNTVATLWVPWYTLFYDNCNSYILKVEKSADSAFQSTKICEKNA